MKLLLILTILATLFVSCGKETEQVDNSTETEIIKYVDNPYIAPEAPESFVSFSDFNVTCLSYRYNNTFKRRNAKVRMDISNHSTDKVTLINLGWERFVTLERNVLTISDSVVKLADTELESSGEINLEIIAENGKVRLEIEGNVHDLDLEYLPANIVYCHPDQKIVNSVEVLGTLE